jgi:hypothetical protein
MTQTDLLPYVETAGGKRQFARQMNISERYVDMLLSGERTMSKELDELIRLKVLVPQPKDAGN